MGELSRRQFTRIGLAAGAAIAATRCSRADAPYGTPNNPARGPQVNRNAIQDVTLRLVGTGASQIHEVRKKAEEDLGFNIDMRSFSADESLRFARTEPDEYDLFTVDYAGLPLIAPSGSLQPIHTHRIDTFDSINAFFTQGTFEGRPVERSQGTAPYQVMYLQGAESSEFSDNPTNFATLIPFQYSADTIGYRPDLTQRAIASWGELLNEEFRGQVALLNRPQLSILDVALAAEALGVMEFEDKGNMTREEIDQLIGLLIEQKRNGQFWGLWAMADESVDWMAKRDVALQPMWVSAVSTLKSRGVNCIAADLREGYRGWSNGLGLSSSLSGIALDAAYAYINWTLEGWAGAFLMRQGYYSAIPENARKYMSQSEWEFWYKGDQALGPVIDPLGRRLERRGVTRSGGSFVERFGAIACWNSIMDENRYLVRKWDEFMATTPTPENPE
ncbi:MAG: extracellular solute-binding protein [Cyanobacteria bacterium J06638_22]